MNIKRFSRNAASTETIPAMYVHSGAFAIGSDRPDECPLATVTVDAFWIGRYSVTNEQFGWFIRDGGYTDQSLWTPEVFRWIQNEGIAEPAFWWDERFNARDQPVTGISFYEAAAFSLWFGGRLPTEVEWEAAGRGQDGRTFPWGEKRPNLSLANFAPDFVPRQRSSRPVTKYRNNVSPFGCRQMVGNVFEWCVDFYHFDTPKRRGGTGFVEDRPSGRRVLKGGAWTTNDDRIRLPARWSYSPDLRDNILGFRIVFDKQQQRE